MRGLFFASLLFALIYRAAAADPVPAVEPVKVTITATDPVSAEAGPSTGLFTVHRTGATASAVTVLYKISGTAVAPGDYQELPGSVTIAAGASSAALLVQPVDDGIAEEDETVVVTLISPIQPLSSTAATAPVPLYQVAQPSSATVVIKDNDLGNVTLPTVNIRVTDPKAAEPDNPGKVRVSRLGDSHAALVVEYDVVQTPITVPLTPTDAAGVADPIVQVAAATSGVDYQPLPGSVTIPAGEKSILITIKPINDQTVEPRKHVTLKLKPAAAYNINQPDTATVFLEDNDPENIPPGISIATPANGASFQVPAVVSIVAQATDKDGTVVKVEFFANGKSVGVTTATAASASPVNPFQISWKSVTPGEYTFTAKATDNSGGTAVSAPVKIKVTAAISGPVVTIKATQPQVLESDIAHPGLFKITRTGDLQSKLNVRYTVTGSADAGVDYTTLPGLVTIPVGESSATLQVIPVPDKLSEGKETLIVTLVQPPVAATVINPPAPEDIYLVGSPKSATVTVYDQLPNVAPKVTITNPKNEGTFDSGTTIKLTAEATDSDGKVQEVTFFVDEKAVGSATKAPYTVTWDSPSAGKHLVVAVAKDDLGATTTSAAVHVTIRPLTQATLVINTPKEGASFTAPADITIMATAVDPKGYISRVEFYANDQKIGVSEITFIRAPDPGTPIQHTFEWTKVPAGKYILTAKAKDSAGAAVTSPPVTVTVLPVLAPTPFQIQSVAPGHRILFEGEIGQRYSIQTSADLSHWIEMGTVTNKEGTFEYVEANPANVPHRFYRAVPVQE